MRVLLKEMVSILLSFYFFLCIFTVGICYAHMKVGCVISGNRYHHSSEYLFYFDDSWNNQLCLLLRTPPVTLYANSDGPFAIPWPILQSEDQTVPYEKSFYIYYVLERIDKFGEDSIETYMHIPYLIDYVFKRFWEDIRVSPEYGITNLNQSIHYLVELTTKFEHKFIIENSAQV